MRKRLAIASAVLLVVSIVGFGAAWELNDTVFDKYKVYGEVPIPGSRTLHLPEGDIKVSFHTEIAGTMEGGGLRVPQDLEAAITPPSGAAAPKFIRSVGGTTADNQDVRVWVGVARILVAGDYTVVANGKTSGYLSPRLSFGHGSSYGFLPWVFVGLGGASLLALMFLMVSTATASHAKQLDHIASLHNSGALSDEEYEAARRRALDDL
jgi:hypothetical protein